MPGATFEDLALCQTDPVRRAHHIACLLLLELLLIIVAAADPAKARANPHSAYGPNSLRARIAAGETFGLPRPVAVLYRRAIHLFSAQFHLDLLLPLLTPEADQPPAPPAAENAPAPPAAENAPEAPIATRRAAPASMVPATQRPSPARVVTRQAPLPGPPIAKNAVRLPPLRTPDSFRLRNSQHGAALSASDCV